MDEKMDPSFGANKVLSFEEARSSGKLPAASTITPSQIVGLAKQLLKLQVAHRLLCSSTLLIRLLLILEF